VRWVSTGLVTSSVGEDQLSGAALPDRFQFDAAADANRTLHASVSSSAPSGALGGVVSADQKCSALAIAAGLKGTYRAWTSVAGTNAADRITSNGPCYLLPVGAGGVSVGGDAHASKADARGVAPLWPGSRARSRLEGDRVAQADEAHRSRSARPPVDQRTSRNVALTHRHDR